MWVNDDREDEITTRHVFDSLHRGKWWTRKLNPVNVDSKERFLIDKGSMMLGGLAGGAASAGLERADDALGVVSVLSGVLVSSNGCRLLRGMGVRGYTWRGGVAGKTVCLPGRGRSSSGSRDGKREWLELGLVMGSGDGLRGPWGLRSDRSEELRDSGRDKRSSSSRKGDCARIVGVVERWLM